MSEEQEAIRQEMDETTNSLSDKFNLLEEKVVETVSDASEGVKNAADAVKEAVQDTVESVKSSVGETVDSVKETFSLSSQVDRRPWAVMGGGVAAGFLVGYLLSPPAPAARKPQPEAATPPRRTGNGFHKEAPAARFVEEPQRSTEPAQPSLFSQLGQTFEKEITQIKGLAIGTLAGVLRDLAVTVAPEMMRNSVKDVFNDVTTKLGGQPFEGQIIPDSWQMNAKPTTDTTTEEESRRAETVRYGRQTAL